METLLASSVPNLNLGNLAIYLQKLGLEINTAHTQHIHTHAHARALA
jgi:hypothetical protein